MDPDRRRCPHRRGGCGFYEAMAQTQGPASATVLSIGEGDTIRLACIDAPEMAQAPDGANARSYLQSRLRVDSSVTINLALAEDGQAFAYRRFLGQCDAKSYLDAEVRASRHRTGVWRVPGGIIRPWDFRHGRASARSGGDSGSVPMGRWDVALESRTVKS